MEQKMAQTGWKKDYSVYRRRSDAGIDKRKRSRA